MQIDIEESYLYTSAVRIVKKSPPSHPYDLPSPTRSSNSSSIMTQYQKVHKVEYTEIRIEYVKMKRQQISELAVYVNRKQHRDAFSSKEQLTNQAVPRPVNQILINDGNRPALGATPNSHRPLIY